MRLLVVNPVVPENESVDCSNDILTSQFRESGRSLHINKLCLLMLFKVLESSVWLYKADLVWLARLHLDIVCSEGVKACADVPTCNKTTPR